MASPLGEGERCIGAELGFGETLGKLGGFFVVAMGVLMFCFDFYFYFGGSEERYFEEVNK